jgi:hypothetical protein
MSIVGINNGQTPAAQTGGQGATQQTARVGDQVGRSGGFSALAAQNIASTTGQGGQANPPRTGAQPLNATGRGRIVNIIV